MAGPRGKDKSELFGGKRKDDDARPSMEGMRTADLVGLEEEVDVLEKDTNELRAQYELYFMGVERREPVVARDGLRARLRRLKEARHHNTALKFRIQMLQARMVSLETYWGRVNRQREAGTYKRDVEKVRRREAELAALEEKQARLAAEKQRPGDPAVAQTKAVPPAKTDGRAMLRKDLRAAEDEVGTAPAPGTVSLMPGASVNRPQARRPEDLTDSSLQTLYQTYVTAKRRCGEPVDVRFEEMAASLRKQVPKLIQSTGAQVIEFKVAIKGGRAILKAVPKD